MTTEEFVAYLKKRHQFLYHFTDARNVSSIAHNGLLSTAELHARGIRPVHGGDEQSLHSDASKGFDRYVSLCFFPKHPMEHAAKNEGRIGTTRFLRIAPEVLLTNGVLMCMGMANANAAVVLPPQELAGSLDYQAMYTYLDWRVQEYQDRRLAVEKYEVLVPNYVPDAFILNL